MPYCMDMLFVNAINTSIQNNSLTTFGKETQKLITYLLKIIYFSKLTRKTIVADIQFFQRNKMKKRYDFGQAENKEIKFIKVLNRDVLIMM